MSLVARVAAILDRDAGRDARAESRGPAGREDFGLLQHRPGRRLLLVGRVAVLAQHALDEAPQVGADVLAQTTIALPSSASSRFSKCSTTSRATRAMRLSAPTTASSATRFLKSAVNRRRRRVVIPLPPQALEYTLTGCPKKRDHLDRRLPRNAAPKLRASACRDRRRWR